jgi:hypothetical protein
VKAPVRPTPAQQQIQQQLMVPALEWAPALRVQVQAVIPAWVQEPALAPEELVQAQVQVQVPQQVQTLVELVPGELVLAAVLALEQVPIPAAPAVNYWSVDVGLSAII